MQKSYALWFKEHLGDSGAAAERAIEHARAVGDGYIESDMRGHLLATVGLGPRPLADGSELLARALEEGRARGERRLEMNALRGLGAHSAWVGRFDEARRLVAQGREIQKELGLMIDYWSSAQLAAHVAGLAGDLEEAARELREGCEGLEALGETAFLSTTAAELAQVEALRGDREAAERWLQVAERTASRDDRASQIGMEVARGQLLADGDDDAAEPHFRRALDLVDEIDSPLWRTEVRLSVAEALGAERRDRAVVLIREALELAEAKGLLAHAAEARRMLEELDERP